MKTLHLYLIAISLTVATSSCTNNADKNAESQQNTDSASVSKSLLTSDSMKSSFISMINEIDRNLLLIRSKEGVIVLGPRSNMDPNLSQKDRIMRNIQMINGLLESNRERLNELENLVREKNSTNAELNRILDSRKSEFATLYNDNERLKMQLKTKSYVIEDLERRLSDAEIQEEILGWMIEDLNGELNTAYYVVGTYKELKDHNLADKSGGVLGLGRTKSLDEDFDQSYFSRIDVRITQIIPIYGNKANLLSKHASDSYSFNQEEDIITGLNITDPNKFWMASKYLVIEITI